MDFHEFSQLSYRKLKSIFIQNLVEYYGENEAQSVFNYWILERNHWSLKEWVLNLDNPLGSPEILWNDYQNLLNKMPVQYVVEKAYFMNLPFYVNYHVLIPRPETEILVRKVLSSLSNVEKGKILDVCSGSGCIPIALKKQLFHFDIQAIEISQEAIEVALKNAQIHNVYIHWIQKSIFDFQWNDFENLDVIISNPPYLPISEKFQLKEHVVNYEPSIALFSGDNPLVFYEKITQLATNWLKNNGFLIYEVHFQYATDVKNILNSFNFRNIEVIQDDFGKDRVVLGYKN